MRALICGDRNWTNRARLFDFMDSAHQREAITCVIEGEARGADTLGRLWAEQNEIPVEKYPADWNGYGKAAGPVRNNQMLREGRPDVVFAFHDNISASKGTKHMISIAKASGLKVYLVEAELFEILA